MNSRTPRRFSSIIRIFGLGFLLLIFTLLFSFLALFDRGTKIVKRIFHGTNDQEKEKEYTLKHDPKWWGEVSAEGCPYAYSWDGSKFVCENDVLMSPGSFHLDAAVAKSRYETRTVPTDLLKLKTTARSEEILIRIAEEEPEQSYFDRVALYQLVHPQNTEVFVSGDAKEILGVEADDITSPSRPVTITIDKQNISYLPEEGTTLHYGSKAEFRFKNLNPQREYLLLADVALRGWGVKELNLLNLFPPQIKAAAILGTVSFALAIHGEPTTSLPLLMLFDGQGKSIRFSYRKHGRIIEFGTCHPRLFRATEALVVPRDAITSDGALEIELIWTRTHRLYNIVAVPLARRFTTELEPCEFLGGMHSNSTYNATVQALTMRNFQNYLPLVQGEWVDLKFRRHSRPIPHDSIATYFLASDGYFSSRRVRWIDLFSQFSMKRPSGTSLSIKA